MTECFLCPRMCGADREGAPGFCGAGAEIEVSKIMLHHWEEPPVSGPDPADEARGSGAIFFTHCSLGCVFCQNGKISRRGSRGTVMTPEALAGEMLSLEARGAYNINCVSPTHYSEGIARAVRLARSRGLSVPVVWNTGGYERAQIIRALRDTVDVYLTDFKYASPALAARYSGAPDYPEAAREALGAMVETAGPCVFGPDGMLRRGVIVRHLVLPGCREDSVRVLRAVAETVPVQDVRLSLMAQYTPDFLPGLPETGEPDAYREIRRRVTSYEYAKVAEEAERLGFDGWMQERASAVKRFTPDF